MGSLRTVAVASNKRTAGSRESSHGAEFRSRSNSASSRPPTPKGSPYSASKPQWCENSQRWRDELGRYTKLQPSGENTIVKSEDVGLIDSQENQKIAEIAKVVENAFNRLGENNQLALQLDIV